MQNRSDFRLASAGRWYRRYQGYEGYRCSSHAVITHDAATSSTLPLVLLVPPVPPVTPVPPPMGSWLRSRMGTASTSRFVLPMSHALFLLGRRNPWA